MSLQALPFVNWILWGALAGGSLLAVGITEWLGGTTRGYRLFMAWLVAIGGVVWLVSELNLAPVPVVGGTSGLRRTLVWAFVVAAGGYLVASLASWPRSGLAVGGGVIGILALVTLAAAGGTANPPILAAGLASAALALGSVNAAMLLGHWYLVTPKLSPAPLQRLIWLLIGALAVQGLLAAWAVVVGSDVLLAEGLAWLTTLRFGVGIVFPFMIAILALLATRATSLQATTGLLYVGLATVMAGTIGAASLSYLSGTPV
ncbi:MAG: hypothetical protein ACRDFZ_05290 [Candidatus Limnocylindria bacterium]